MVLPVATPRCLRAQRSPQRFRRAAAQRVAACLLLFYAVYSVAVRRRAAAPSPQPAPRQHTPCQSPPASMPGAVQATLLMFTARHAMMVFDARPSATSTRRRCSVADRAAVPRRCHGGATVTNRFCYLPARAMAMTPRRPCVAVEYARVVVEGGVHATFCARRSPRAHDAEGRRMPPPLTLTEYAMPAFGCQRGKHAQKTARPARSKIVAARMNATYRLPCRFASAPFRAARCAVTPPSRQSVQVMSQRRQTKDRGRASKDVDKCDSMLRSRR